MSLSRRAFIGKLTITTAMIQAFENNSIAGVPAASGYGLKVLATNWGFAGDRKAFADKVAQDGYDGVENWVPQDPGDRKDFLSVMKDRGLSFGLLVGGSDPDPVKHLYQFQKALDIALEMSPLYINCHSGKDWFSFEDNMKILETGNRQAEKSGIPVCHETHRGRMMYSAPVASEFLKRMPQVKLTADLSHWCNVHESLLEDQPDALRLALSRTEHIHARIGHAQGPQVNDPRAPEWEKAVATHLSWWDVVVSRKKKEGKLMTVLTEFGPADYMPTTPYARNPLANQWAVNVHMKDLLRKRYS